MSASTLWGSMWINLFLINFPIWKKPHPRKLTQKGEMTFLPWNLKYFRQNLFVPILFFQGSQGRRHLNNLCFLFRVGGILPRVQAASGVGYSLLRNGHTLFMGRMEKLLPGRAGGPSPTPTGPQSWARNDFTEPTFPSAPGYKAPDPTVRAEFPILPSRLFSPGTKCHCRSLEKQENRTPGGCRCFKPPRSDFCWLTWILGQGNPWITHWKDLTPLQNFFQEQF